MLAKRKPKQVDVAKLAGVSQATVSLVLSHNESVAVPEETRHRVFGAATHLGYVTNGLARSLRTQKTYTIASVIPDITNPFYPAFERGVQDVAESRTYDLVVYNTDGKEEKERRCLSALLQGRIDGVIATFFHLREKDLAVLLDHNIAVVLLEEPTKTKKKTLIDRVFVDNSKAAEVAVRHLVERGHTRIAMLSGQHETLSTRAQGYTQALKHVALEPLIIETGDFTEACGYTGMLEVLKVKPRPTAVFAFNDVMAMGALVALREHQLRVPHDMALVGFDDIPAARILAPALTTVSQFQENLGKRAAELLIERLQGLAPATPRFEEMPFRLMLRDST